MADLIFKDEAYKIIGCCFEVYNELGPGFLEAVYQEALSIEFIKQKIPFIPQAEMNVFYKGIQLKKKYYPDFLCFDEIVLEIKAETTISPADEAQLLNYLKGTKNRWGYWSILAQKNYNTKDLQTQRIIREISRINRSN